VLRISKLTDYGTVLLAYLAANQSTIYSAAQIAGATRISMPTASKLLKLLARSGLVISCRGINGGYQLSKDASKISVTDIIDALEGPISITECSGSSCACDFENTCNVSISWQKINILIRDMLDDVSLKDLLENKGLSPHFHSNNFQVIVENTLK
tara:strand:+ start:631 stop:1095 length:465 start_codon:yes stop_codon:yes gene_type:complete